MEPTTETTETTEATTGDERELKALREEVAMLRDANEAWQRTSQRRAFDPGAVAYALLEGARHATDSARAQRYRDAATVVCDRLADEILSEH